MLKDYARCVYYESKGNPARALRVAVELVRSRINHGIGPFYYSLFRFADIPKAKWGSYLRDKEFFARVLKNANSHEMRTFLKDKARCYQHCLDSGLPTPAIVCVVVRPNHPFSSRAITCAHSLDEWRNAMESAPDELFVKPVDGSYGSGTFIIRRLGQKFAFGETGDEGSIEELHRYVLDRLKNETALLVQPRIRPHPRVLAISSGTALATVRIVTALIENKAKVLYACVKLPVGTSITDNFSHGLSGNLVAAVNIDTGILSKAWSSSRSNWPVMRPMEVHPDTGAQIAGSALPLWQEAIDLALAGQNSLPHLRTIGWDIAITDDGVTLVEANGGYNIDLLQVAHQRGLKSELISAIGCHINPVPAQL